MTIQEMNDLFRDPAFVGAAQQLGDALDNLWLLMNNRWGAEDFTAFATGMINGTLRDRIES